MTKRDIKGLLESQLSEDGMYATGVDGVRLFRVTESVRCAPAVYEPSIVAILNGTKEAILDGASHVYGSDKYMCCSMTMPVEAGTPSASPENPLLGVYISLDTRVMTELVIEMESRSGAIRRQKGTFVPPGIKLANWDEAFSDALSRLIQLKPDSADAALLGKGRLRELYYSVLLGEAGDSARCAFGVGNEIARSIEYLSSRLNEPVTIDELADQAAMSRAVFHRKFKQATAMSPIQFVKSMRLNTAAMKIAGGMNINEAAMDVGYVSSSQFSREFKRMYGKSPREWGDFKQMASAFG